MVQISVHQSFLRLRTILEVFYNYAMKICFPFANFMEMYFKMDIFDLFRNFIYV